MNENTINNMSNTSTPSKPMEPYAETQNRESENISFMALGKMSSTKWFGATTDSPYPPFCRKLNGDQSPLVENIVIDPNAQAPVEAKVISLTPLKTSEKGISPQLTSLGNMESSGLVTKRKLLSTISGVFAPVALSMFSVLLFLRLGFVVGHAGLGLTVVIYLLTYFILLTTVLSVAAVATNGAVEGGGAYFMISRTLGPEFGGGIGAVFFAANVFSSALYTVGCAEALLESFGPGGTYTTSDSSPSGTTPLHLPEGPGYALLYATAVNALNLIVCLSGSSAFARASLAVLTVVVGCAVSVPLSLILRPTPWCVPLPSNNILTHPPLAPLSPSPNSSTISPPYTPPACGNYTGFSWSTLTLNMGAEYGRDYTLGTPVTFMTVFGVVFSGATGIMAGANMSGDLKHPQSSIPRGTLLAVAFTFTTYLLLSFLVAGSSSRYLLQNDYIFLAQINIWAPFVTVGILLATITAGLSNLMGASRVLEAVAKDRIFGSVLNRLTWTTKSGNPIPAVLVSWLLVQAVVTMGSLNRIAGVTTVFFLLSYLAINVSCCALELASAPNFRPSFKYFTWYTALSGSLACLFMMFVVTPTFSTLGLVICAALVLTLHWKTPAASWGSLSQALLFHQVRKYLLLLDPRKEHVKYWRPQILQLVADPRTCCELIDFANDLKKSGLFVVGHVSLRRPTAPDQDSPKKVDAENTDIIAAELPYWLALMDSLKVKAFVELTSSESIREGCRQLMRLSGLGAMKPNTIILGFLDDRAPKDSFLSRPQLFRNRRPRGVEGGVPIISMPLDQTPQSTPKDWPPLDPWWWSTRPSRTLARPLTPSVSASTLTSYVAGGEDSVFDPSTDQSHIGPSLRVGACEYIGILRDALAMNKNLILARNFSDLDKRTLLVAPPPAPSSSGGAVKRVRGGPRCYIDVWLQDFFQPASPPTYDSPATLFLLQLACVLNMVRAWNRRSALRVFICIDPQLQDPAPHETHLKSLLSQLRIPAQVRVVEWNVRRHFYPHSPQSQEATTSILSPQAFLEYLGYANRLIAKYSPPKPSPAHLGGGPAPTHNSTVTPTAVLFAYLPSPPPANATELEASTFLTQLEILTRHLPPTCMVHGISTVTTTML